MIVNIPNISVNMELCLVSVTLYYPLKCSHVQVHTLLENVMRDQIVTSLAYDNH